MNLEAFLERARRTPFAWGRFDCSLWLADWLVERGYRDPAQALRGTYADQAGAERLAAAVGGLPVLLAGFARSLGLGPTQEPLPGDVGVVLGVTRRGVEPGGAIRCGRRWALLGETGLIVASATPLAAWRV